ncbi:MAG: hypothetical protein IJ124_09605 [Clostridia bacterium]|nr:hypothetical protein [Clostridia bacterium]
MYPYYNSDYERPTEFAKAEPRTIYRTMYLEDRLLPPGTYYLQFTVYDMFMRPLPLECIEAEWTGESMILPDGFSWEGTEELIIPDQYW